MNYYMLEPEVAGGIGAGSKILYENGKIKEVIFLEYEFFGWLGDELLTAHPCFIVTESLKNDIISNGLTGVGFEEISMTFSDEFTELYADKKVPQFVRLICDTLGDKLQCDFYLNDHKELIVSENALNILKRHKIKMCTVQTI